MKRIFEMEKILFVAFLSSFAGFITAVISMIKLVNEKEGKISEFRQSWIDSARASISDLIAKLRALTVALEYQGRLTVLERKLQTTNPSEHNERRLSRISETMLKLRDDIIKNKHDYFQSYALCKLHFKPNDCSLLLIEDKLEFIFKAMEAVQAAKIKKERDEAQQECHKYIKEINEIAQGILKQEWERVKGGEKIYKRTKSFSLYGGSAMLFILLCIGGYTFFLAKNTVENNLHDNKSPLKISKCWKLQGFGENLFKLNSCTGELIELHRNTQ